MTFVKEKRQSPLVILRRIYLNIVEGNHCAAKLIEYFKHWRNWKVKHHRTDWTYMPLRQIYEDLMGEHSLHVIRAAIALLERLNIIERRNNPNGQDKTWQYRLKLDVLNSLLPPEHGMFQPEHPAFTVEQHQHDLPLDIKITANSDAAVISVPEENTGTPHLVPSVPQNPEVPTARENDSNIQGNPEEQVILDAVRTSGIKTNAQIKALVLKHTLAEVLAVLALYQKAKERGEIKNPEGWVTKCFQDRWVQDSSDAGGTEEPAVVDMDWTLHPDWTAMLEYMQIEGTGAFRGCKEWLDFKTRCAVANWAEANNLIWVGEYAV